MAVKVIIGSRELRRGSVGRGFINTAGFKASSVRAGVRSRRATPLHEGLYIPGKGQHLLTPQEMGDSPVPAVWKSHFFAP